MGLACAIALILLLPLLCGVSARLLVGRIITFADNYANQEAKMCQECGGNYRFGAPRFGPPRPAGLPPGGVKRLDVSLAFGFGLPPAGPSDLPL